MIYQGLYFYGDVIVDVRKENDHQLIYADGRTLLPTFIALI